MLPVTLLPVNAWMAVRDRRTPGPRRAMASVVDDVGEGLGPRPLRVEAEIGSGRRNLLQLFTGLAMLDRLGVITLSQRVVRRKTVTHPGTCVLRTDDVTMVVDARDSHDLVDALATQADVYAKRSYQPGGYESAHARVIPYGLNYPVYPPGVDLRALRRVGLTEGGRVAGRVARAFGVDRVIGWPETPRVRDISPRPLVTGNGPQVVFFARVWPLLADDRPTALGRDHINEQRAACIRALRREFGPRFVGGLEPNAVARRQFPDCLAARADTAKLAYLRLAGSVPVGVATTGLALSTGWKFGEYVAMGRAIVTEPLLSEVPGSLEEGTNYVTFASPDDCVDACRRIVDDPDRAARMSRANVAYYEQYLHPDRLVANLLRQARPGRP